MDSVPVAEAVRPGGANCTIPLRPEHTDLRRNSFYDLPGIVAPYRAARYPTGEKVASRLKIRNIALPLGDEILRNVHYLLGGAFLLL